MLASMPNRCDQSHDFRSQIVYFSSPTSSAGIKQSKAQHQTQQAQPASRWTVLSPYFNSTSAVYASTDDLLPFDCYSSQQIFSTDSAALPMHSEQAPQYYPCRLDNGQDIPRTVTSPHHRDSPLSTMGSAGSVSPFTANISNPQISGDIFDFTDIPPFSSPKNLTPAQTQSHEELLASQFTPNFQSNSNLAIDLMPISELSFPDSPSVAANPSHGSPAPSSISEQEKEQKHEEESRNSGLWITEDVICEQGYNKMTGIDQTISEIYEDSIYNSNIQLSSTPSPSKPATATNNSSHNEIFEQRLQTASNHHMQPNSQVPLVLPAAECDRFRHGCPLAPQNNFATDSQSLRIGTVPYLHKQQKLEHDAQVLQEQLCEGSTTHSTSTTVSPTDVDLIYHDDDEKSLVSLFPTHQKPQNILSSYQLKQEAMGSDENISTSAFSGMESTSCENSSFPPHAAQNQNSFNFSIPAIDESLQFTTQQFSYLQPQVHRQNCSVSNHISNFPVSKSPTKSRKSEYELTSDKTEIKKPTRVSADTGTYTCTYHGCTLRFDTPTRLQRHKREGHRSSSAAAVAAAAASLNGITGSGMTSTAQRNSQAGPHRVRHLLISFNLLLMFYLCDDSCTDKILV